MDDSLSLHENDQIPFFPGFVIPYQYAAPINTAPPIIFPILTGIKLAAMPASDTVSGWGIITEMDSNVMFATLCSKPDVINAKAGYVPTEEMGELNYRVKPLNEYVK